jgi:hypothetical protein
MFGKLVSISTVNLGGTFYRSIFVDIILPLVRSWKEREVLTTIKDYLVVLKPEVRALVRPFYFGSRMLMKMGFFLYLFRAGIPEAI